MTQEPTTVTTSNRQPKNGKHHGKRHHAKKRFTWKHYVLVLLTFTLVSLWGGLLIGYVVLGKGTIAEALNPQSWWHVLRIVIG
ncbi:MAG: DNA-directed RNA polymerase subunit beta [Candidatus Carbobacillus sp.]|nr:DNA-directed RNA polymerase subunit beta [Candidatus Carbobacillus sp.]